LSNPPPKRCSPSTPRQRARNPDLHSCSARESDVGVSLFRGHRSGRHAVSPKNAFLTSPLQVMAPFNTRRSRKSLKKKIVAPHHRRR
jgi:hypothetical protein